MNFLDKIDRNGEFSFSPYQLPPKHGFMVAIKDMELKLTDKDNINNVVEKYSNNYITKENNLFVGGWEHEGVIYIDISKYFDNLEDAIRVGLLSKQLAIYDIANSKDIRLVSIQTSGTETQKAESLYKGMKTILNSLKS